MDKEFRKWFDELNMPANLYEQLQRAYFAGYIKGANMKGKKGKKKPAIKK